MERSIVIREISACRVVGHVDQVGELIEDSIEVVVILEADHHLGKLVEELLLVVDGVTDGQVSQVLGYLAAFSSLIISPSSSTGRSMHHEPPPV